MILLKEYYMKIKSKGIGKMTLIKIPFNEWSKARLRANHKSATSRNKKYGNVGDIFVVDCGYSDKLYELTYIEKVTLAFVRDKFYWEEGCESEDLFVQIWNDIHPKKKFDDEQKVWLHLFKEIKEGEYRG